MARPGPPCPFCPAPYPGYEGVPVPKAKDEVLHPPLGQVCFLPGDGQLPCGVSDWVVLAQTLLIGKGMRARLEGGGLPVRKGWMVRSEKGPSAAGSRVCPASVRPAWRQPSRIMKEVLQTPQPTSLDLHIGQSRERLSLALPASPGRGTAKSLWKQKLQYRCPHAVIRGWHRISWHRGHRHVSGTSSSTSTASWGASGAAGSASTLLTTTDRIPASPASGLWLVSTRCLFRLTMC